MSQRDVKCHLLLYLWFNEVFIRFAQLSLSSRGLLLTLNMADLRASSLALMSAAGALGKLINSLRNAPDELLALSNEVADLQIVLSEVYQYRSEVLSEYV
jgi:hypothetical protein